MRDTTPVSIRAMTRHDFPALEELYYDFHEYHARGVPCHLRSLDRWEAWDRVPLHAALEKILADDNARIFVAEVEEDLVGLVEVYVRQDVDNPAVDPRRYMELQSLIVAAPFRRRGLAHQLVQYATAWGGEKGAMEIRLNVWEFDEATQRFYEQLGFTTLQRRMVLPLANQRRAK